MRRPGPKMLEARDYVRSHPGCNIADVVRTTHPRSRLRGYQAVHRTIKAGLIEAKRFGRDYALTPPKEAP